MKNKIREIGSELWNVPISNKRNNLFPESVQWYLSGRSALQAIIKELTGCHTIMMPSWCCDSIIKPFVDAGMDVHFYPVYWKDRLVQEINLDSDVLFLMNYFGYMDQRIDLSGYKGKIIRDVTHSIFSFTYSDADYYFGSLRKWCGVWTGGYAWTRDGHGLNMTTSDDGGYTVLREKAMWLKNSYINGSGVVDKSYLKIYNQAEKYLDNVGIVPAADRDVQLAQKLDVKKIRKQRRANAKILKSAFPGWLVFSDLKPAKCPMFVPILVPGGIRNELHQYLIKNDIYCPIHWPVSKYHRLDEMTEFIYKNELSLVCDQRYTEADMYRIVGVINQFWRRSKGAHSLYT